MRQRTPPAATACLLGLAATSGCVLVLDPPHLRDGSAVPLDASQPRDALVLDAPPGVDARPTRDVPVSDAGPLDATLSGDAVALDAGAPDVIELDAGSPDIATHEMGAPDDCTAAVAPVGSIRYAGTTCGARDDYTLSCNTGPHPDVVARIDATPGTTWTIRVSEGLVYSATLSGTCDFAGASVCGSDTRADAGYIAFGPFTAPGTIFFAVETYGAMMCGPYVIDITRSP